MGRIPVLQVGKLKERDSSQVTLLRGDSRDQERWTTEGAPPDQQVQLWSCDSAKGSLPL